MSDSPVAILYDSYGNEVSIKDGYAIPSNKSGLPIVGIDGSGNAQIMSVDTSGHPTVVGAGSAGTPSGGVVSIQGVSGGTVLPVGDGGGSLTVDGPLTDSQLRATPVPISGSVTATAGVLPNIETTGSITTTNGTVQLAMAGYRGIAVVITGTWSGILVFETTADSGSTWVTTSFADRAGAGVLPIPTIYQSVSTNGTYLGLGLASVTHVRVRASSYTSGTINIRIVASDIASQVIFTQTGILQNVIASTSNSSSANLASQASFTGTAESTLGVAGIQINIKSDQAIIVNVQQSNDGTNWDISDFWSTFPNEGDSRTVQATASYFRIIAQNIGGDTTTYFRLQVALCPIVEVVPRTLTEHGRLRIASSESGFQPDPSSYLDHDANLALSMDGARSLNVRAKCLTDESSFRDDFIGTTIYTDISGTCYFTNGAKYVSGSGTSFTTELNTQNYIKLSSHADSDYMKILKINSDDFLELEDLYTGATANGTGRSSYWVYAIGTGGSITQTGSEILIASGTTSGSLIMADRTGDYLPYTLLAKARVTQRVANQEIAIGFADDDYGSRNHQALIIFNGTDNTKVRLRTGCSSSDIEETLVTVPNSGVTSSSLVYNLEVMVNKVVLFISGVKCAEHVLHIPGPYALLELHQEIKNTGTPSGSTTLAVDVFAFNNFNRVEISTLSKGDQISTKELRSSVSATANVSAAVADTVLIAANQNRLGGTVYNDSIAILYLKLGTGASTTSFTIALNRYDYYEIPTNYVGNVNGYWSAATGTARVTELT